MNEQPQNFSSQGEPALDNSASYGKRALAFALDMLFLFFAMTFVVSYLGLEPVSAVDMQAAQTEMIAKLQALPPQKKMLLALSPYLAFFLLHGPSLFRTGQTLGKRIVGITIVTLDNQKPAFLQLITQRYLPQWLLGMIPMLGIFLRLTDILLIFRGDKRCAHDLIARTKVIDLKIKVPEKPNSFIA